MKIFTVSGFEKNTGMRIEVKNIRESDSYRALKAFISLMDWRAGMIWDDLEATEQQEALK